MARPINTDPLPLHPAVGIDRFLERKYGRIAYCAPVTCPDCKSVRPYPTSTLRQQLARPNFTGRCARCSINATREGRQRQLRANPKAGRWVASNGYACISQAFVRDADLPLFRQIVGTRKALLEHRWVMALHLGRPLRSDELVDHMNGNKIDNRIENLRLYVRGKQQPGSAPGHGTYYHEWQMALRRIRELESY